MSEQPKETLSALMDNEASDFELRRVLKQIAEDDCLGDSWRRYHITRSALKQEGLNQKLDISASVMSALEQEAPLAVVSADEKLRPVDKAKSYFLKPLASMAVAASVTAMVILGGQNFGLGQSETGSSLTAQTSAFQLPALAAPRDFMQAQFGARQSPVIEQVEPDIIRLNQGLNSYIDQHQLLLSRESVSASPGWLPEGFEKVQSAVAPGTDLTVFSNGKHSFTVCVERTGSQAVPEGATQIGDMVAVGKRTDNLFITVVGDLPLMMADRIASSVTIH
ncbi:MucB/RseB C-terminal domain-containing protein [Amphritea sp. HPY]|uniref:MucB/RseB C-terminal domain-containing protein n=1 Tax=Amphritea sp. HPY TaxID=3421652 RepID=UPI003D7C5BC0